MTAKQKYIIHHLLQGGYVVHYGPTWFRLRTANHVVLAKFGRKAWKEVKDVLKEKEPRKWFLSRKQVRSLDGRSYIKKAYKKLLRDEKSNAQHGSAEAGAEKAQPGSEQQACYPCFVEPILQSI